MVDTGYGEIYAAQDTFVLTINLIFRTLSVHYLSDPEVQLWGNHFKVMRLSAALP
ncbi:MAG: hypothetical protein U1F76_29170 [Candidatus Competibacteraceae bacterium]